MLFGQRRAEENEAQALEQQISVLLAMKSSDLDLRAAVGLLLRVAAFLLRQRGKS